MWFQKNAPRIPIDEFTSTLNGYILFIIPVVNGHEGCPHHENLICGTASPGNGLIGGNAMVCKYLESKDDSDHMSHKELRTQFRDKLSKVQM